MRAARMPSGKQVVIGPAAAELVQAAFDTRESAESDLLETPRGEYFVVRTDRVTPARIPTLYEVEAKVTEAWQAEERRKLADAKVKAAVEKAEAGADLAALAKELGLEVRTTKAVTRFEADQPQLPHPAGGAGAVQAGAGQGPVGTDRRRQRHRAPEAGRGGRPRQGKGSARPLRQADRHHGGQRPGRCSSSRRCAPSMA